ncbi:MAG: serine hydrolase domain-containing protein [Kofleriaceae bacterium]
MRLLALAVALWACSSRAPAREVASSDFNGLERAIADGKAPNTTSVLVMHRSSIVYEAYFDGATADTLHDTRSVGKSITAIAIGIAIGRGLVDLDTRVFERLADLAPFANAHPLKDAITVEDFLTMSSALDCNDDDSRSLGNESNMYPLKHWSRWAVDLPAMTSYVRDATGRGPWRYCTAGTMLLGQLIEHVTKNRADAFIAEHLFGPLGITRWEFERSPSNEVMTGGMLRLRTRDLATIARMLRARGVHGEARVVPASFVDAAFTRHRLAFSKQQEHYGYLFWHRTHRTTCGDVEAWFMSGNGGNLVGVFDEFDAVVVITRTHYNQGREMHDQTKRLLDEHVLPTLCRR